MQVASAPSANYRFVAPDYFRTLSMPFVAGRSFGAADRSQRVVPAVISARVAETLWPGRDPIGRRFTRADPADQFQVVGVVADGHATRLDAPSPLMVYVPYWFNNEGKSVLVVQSSGDAAAIAASVSSAVRQEDPEIAVDAKPLQHVVDASLAGSRYQMSLFVAFGIVALVIATLGVYATTAYGVSRRRREMNIRVALGARVAHVFGLVVRQSSTPVLVGLVVGCAGASVAGRAMASLLFESRAVEPMVLASVVTVVGVAAFVAAAVAAKQGLRIDPSVTLRDD
jgi:hypothetical protein